MWYNLDLTKLAVHLLPPVLRSSLLTALLGILILPLRYLYMRFSELRQNVSNRLDITGNVAYLEKALNDAFFLHDGQIYIETPSEPERRAFMYFGREQQKGQKMYTSTEAVPYYFRHSEEASVSGVNFTVMVPTFLCTSLDKSSDKFKGRHLETINKILKIYKPAGRTFSIELYDYE